MSTDPKPKWRKTRHPAVQVRHRKGCPAVLADGPRCRCEPSYRSSVWDATTKRPAYSPNYATVDEARGWLADRKRGIAPTTTRRRSGVTVRVLIERFLDAAEAGTATTRHGRRYRASSLSRYRRAADQHIYPECGAADADAMTPADWQIVVEALAAKGLKGQSVGFALAPARAAYKWAASPNRRIVSGNPTLGLDMPARAKRPAPQVVSREQAVAMLAAIPASSARIAWALMFYLGLRVSEAIALDWSDVNWKTNRVTVLASKSPAGEDREIPMPAPLRTILREWQMTTGQRLGPVAPGVRTLRADSTTIWRNGVRAWTAAKLPILSPHDARHTYASWLLASGHTLVEIRDLLGHANVRVTADYLHRIPDSRDAKLDRLDAFLAGASVAGMERN